MPLAGPANRQGRLAADNIFGRAAPFRGTQGTAILGFFDRTAAMTGASEKSLRRGKRAFRKVYIHPMHHAGYYPGAAQQFVLKVLFDPASGKLLGAQGVGGAGVDKQMQRVGRGNSGRHDRLRSGGNGALLFAAVRLGQRSGQHGRLCRQRLAAWRPSATRCRSGSVPARERAATALDVRTPTEFTAGHLPGAVNIPVDDLRTRLSEVPADRPLAVYCQVGQRGYLATRILRQAGLAASNIGGGYKTYRLFYPSIT